MNELGRYCIDTYAWIEYFIGSDKGRSVAEILENSKNEIFTSIVTVAEVVSVSKRRNRDYKAPFNSILNIAKLFDVTAEIAMETGILHGEVKKNIKDFALADAFVLQAARKLNAKIVTGDPHFKTFKEAIMI